MGKAEITRLFDKYVKKLRITPAWDVRLEFVEDGELFDGGRQFGVVDERVEGDVGLFALGPRDGQQLPELFCREIHGFGARGEGVQAKIDGICARREGGERGFEGAGGRKQFNGVHAIAYSIIKGRRREAILQQRFQK